MSNEFRDFLRETLNLSTKAYALLRLSELEDPEESEMRDETYLELLNLRAKALRLLEETEGQP